MKVKRFAHEFGLEIFFLYHEINHLEIKFWVKEMLMASYSHALIALKICWNVTFGHHFDHKLWTVSNFLTWHERFRKYTFGTWIRTQILYFFDGNKESYCHLNMSRRVSGNTDLNYVLMGGRENGSKNMCSWIWLGNFFPISRDQSSWNQIFGKRYENGQLFMILNNFKNVFRSDLRSPFQQ